MVPCPEFFHLLPHLPIGPSAFYNLDSKALGKVLALEKISASARLQLYVRYLNKKPRFAI